MKPTSKGPSTKKKATVGKSKGRPDRKKWDDPPGEEDFFSDKDFEHLMSLEVLADYKIDKDGKIITGPATSSIPIRGTYKEADSDTSEIIKPESDNTTTTVKKQKTTTKKRKPDDEDEVAEKPVHKGTVKKVKTTKPTAVIASSSSPSTSSWTVVDLDEENQRDTQAYPESKKLKKIKPSVTNKKLAKAAKNALAKSCKEEVEEPSDVSSTFNSHAWSKLGVCEPILTSLAEACFDTPTPIQSLTLPASLLGKKDIVGAAETGSGKTLAFAIPILQGIQEDRQAQTSNEEVNEDGFLRALILTPTRELAVQIKRHMDIVSKNTGINVVVIVGGLSEQKQERLLLQQPEVVIATIGRFWEMVQNGNVHLSTLGSIRYLAIDETDRMVERGHFQELEGILEVLNRHPDQVKRRQNFVFSATLAFTHEPPPRLTRKVKRPLDKKKVSPEVKLREIMVMLGIDKGKAKVVDITSRKGTCETLVEMTLTCQLNQKDAHLYYFFLLHPGRTIVFCNSINCVRRLVNLFYLLKLEPLALHSEMVQKQRLRSLERFAENDEGLLIATDVAARGLDITNIQHVIHYQVPKTVESYIHRSGRTARAFKGGLALVLIEPSETTSFWKISQSLGHEEPLPTFPVDGQILHQIQARVNLAIQVEQFEHQVRKKSADVNWVEKAKKDMDLATSEEDQDSDSGKVVDKKNLSRDKNRLVQAKEQLDALLSANSTMLKENQRVLNTFKKIIAGGSSVKV